MRAANVCNLLFGAVAGSLRGPVRDKDTLRRHFFALTLLCSTACPIKSVVVNGARFDPRADVVVSSYTSLRSCAESLGPLLGAPVAANLMPKDAEGNIAVATYLAENEIEGLKRDEEMAKHAFYID
ncbi:hypothetical protein GGTG_01143 [Gaeumannomyces tritici R3-111a-1]|uniref:Uncharacterized protein n=1 Tax=Gaeumannomyces tritici (strain R3-111a-1) TaxID=644352 RepID=J3NIR0_GAET3|nr:hypothetical protein GGTG_01143 [Gaeumannomyces tritici R3-111a-1]EJT81159.1 hypothetical protein GGTG_01143 [Gaeumannomyces tritici R3-111a-1]